MLVSLFYYKSLLILSPCLMQMHKSKATLTLSPCLMQMHKSKATLTLSPCLRGTRALLGGGYSLLPIPYSLLPTHCSLFPTPYSLLSALTPYSLINRANRLSIVAIKSLHVHEVRNEIHDASETRSTSAERTRPIAAELPCKI